MTLEEWFGATDPRPLLMYAQYEPGKPGQVQATVHRLRLFACAAARQAWDLLTTDARSALQAAERFAQGRATQTDLLASAIRQPTYQITAEQLALAAAQAASGLSGSPSPFTPTDAAQFAARAVATRDVGPAPPGLPTSPKWHAAWNAAFAAARAIQANYVRDIVVPPHLILKRDPEWITSTVLALARQMDESGDFSVVPILADAIQDAGCVDETILSCCRTAGNNHVRGNWIVDLILERI